MKLIDRYYNTFTFVPFIVDTVLTQTIIWTVSHEKYITIDFELYYATIIIKKIFKRSKRVFIKITQIFC